MSKRKYTDVEERLIDVIENFFLWYSGKSDYQIAEEYISEEHVDYNDWFTIKESK